MRSEKVSTREMLVGHVSDANGTDPGVRLRELERVRVYWPEDLRARAVEQDPPWRLLVDPTAWGDVDPEEVHAFFRSFLASHWRWPSLDDVRRRFGRVSNHRQPGEVAGQEALPLG